MDDQVLLLVRAVGVGFVGGTIGMWAVVIVACRKRIQRGGNGAAHALMWASSSIVFTHVVVVASRVERIQVEAPFMFVVDGLGIAAVAVSLVGALAALKALSKGHI